MNKYKLINTKTKEEHLCDKVTIAGFDYYVSNETVGFTYNKPTYNSDGKIGLPENRESRKVITTNNPNIDIPKVMNEVEELAYNWLYDNETENKANQGYPLKPMEYGFIKGYNKSQETHPFSEEDMIEFNVWQKSLLGSKNDNWLVEKSDKELLQLWKEQQLKIVYYE